jgi:hypothetical protein
MPLTLDDLRGEPKELDITLVEGKDPLKVWYWPNNYTAEVEVAVNNLGKGETANGPAIELCSKLLSSWDLALPCDAGGFAKLHVGHLVSIISGVMGDQSPKADSSETSVDGSSTAQTQV